MQPTSLRRFTGVAGIAMIPLGLGAIFIAPSIAAAVTTKPASQLAVTGLATALGISSLAFAAACFRRTSLRDSLALHAPSASPAILACYVAGALGISHLLDRMLRSASDWSTSALGEFDRVIAMAEPSEISLLIVGIAIAPGIAEELLFRGSLLSAFRARTGPAQSVFYTSLLFGALHLDPLHVIGAFALGLYFGAMTIATGTVRTSLWCHVVNNLAAIMLVKLDPVGLSEFASAGVGIALIAALTALLALRRQLRG